MSEYPDILPYAHIELDGDLLDIKALEAGLPGAIQAAGREARDFWETLAGQRLNSSRDAYIEGIELLTFLDMAEITLNGKFPTMIETGTGPYSMKDALIDSPKARMNQAGLRYTIIPIAAAGGSPFDPPLMYRTVSEGSDANWIHPGFPGLQLADEVQRELEEVILPKHINKLIDEVL